MSEKLSLGEELEKLGKLRKKAVKDSKIGKIDSDIKSVKNEIVKEKILDLQTEAAGYNAGAKKLNDRLPQIVAEEKDLAEKYKKLEEERVHCFSEAFILMNKAIQMRKNIEEITQRGIWEEQEKEKEENKTFKVFQEVI